MYSYKGKRHIIFFGISLQGTPLKHKRKFFLNHHVDIHIAFLLFLRIIITTKMTTFIKAKFKNLDDQTNNDKYKVAANIFAF